jgi:hypothetical protein
MGIYKTAQICLNGHVITTNIENHKQPYCSKCGAETITHCQNCGEHIQGRYLIDGVLSLNKSQYIAPWYCHSCGNPYPWTEKILNNATELLSLDEGLDSSAKELIKNAIPNLLVDTPETPISIANYRNGMSKAGQIVKDSMFQLLSNVLSETIKNVLFH